MALLSWLPKSAGATVDDMRSARNHRYCRTLCDPTESFPCADSSAAAWNALEEEMALVPSGETVLHKLTAVMAEGGVQLVKSPCQVVAVDTFYIDRHAVKNADYARFVEDGCYKDADLWPERILPHVLQFLDATGKAGPRYWSHGQPDTKKLDHPVVGISWFEAHAYAVWAGKRLPTPAQWQRAGTWSSGSPGEPERRYPWGNAFDAAHANLWASRRGDTVAVTSYLSGCTPNGVCQLTGNVWEWTATRLDCPGDENARIVFDQDLAEIRGGAFDTYFEAQATCQSSSGKPYLYRGRNVGFRCCVGVDQVGPPPDAFDVSADFQDRSFGADSNATCHV